jgi:hypothetical protein
MATVALVAAFSFFERLSGGGDTAGLSPHSPSSRRKPVAHNAAIVDAALAELAFQHAEDVLDLCANFAEAAVASTLPPCETAARFRLLFYSPQHADAFRRAPLLVTRRALATVHGAVSSSRTRLVIGPPLIIPRKVAPFAFLDEYLAACHGDLRIELAAFAIELRTSRLNRVACVSEINS